MTADREYQSSDRYSVGRRRGSWRPLLDQIRTSKPLLSSQRYSLLRSSEPDPELALSSEDEELDTALVGRGRQPEPTGGTGDWDGHQEWEAAWDRGSAAASPQPGQRPAAATER